jgi:hypothetical protein
MPLHAPLGLVLKVDLVLLVVRLRLRKRDLRLCDKIIFRNASSTPFASALTRCAKGQTCRCRRCVSLLSGLSHRFSYLRGVEGDLLDHDGRLF